MRYLGQPCKHFGHKVPSALEGDPGWITFDFGRCHLAATEAELSLHAVASADPQTRLGVEQAGAGHVGRETRSATGAL
ncbi:DUF2218 domain-containing protein [Dongia soli]|uniref:DUF2218 domain-containing protein n=1 Tax=Dongia soli TaxID=600628 RepID=UPI0036078DA9